MSELDEIKRHIRTIPDWPKAGVMFRDITPLLQDPRLLRAMTRIFVERYAASRWWPASMHGASSSGR